MSRLAARIRTGLSLAAGAALLLWLHPRFEAGVLSLVVVTALAGLSIWELDHMGSFRGRKLGWMLSFACAAQVLGLGYLVLARIGLDPRVGLIALYGASALLAWPYLGWGFLASFLGRSLDVQDGRERLPKAGEVVPLSIWLFPPLFSIVLVDHAFGTVGLVVLVLLAKIGDNAGFFVGRALGKTHPFPNVSPGKTVAGCVASLVAGILAGGIVLPLTLGQRTLPGAALGAFLGGLINVAAQAGDLSESWVKRQAGVKDSSPLLGPSGGVLDVIDSLLLAAPVALVAWVFAYGA
jgi:CDP-diglyceride synthetase